MKFYLFKHRFAVLALICFLISNSSLAQVPTYITPGGTSNNSYPFRTATKNKIQWLYLPTDFNTTLPGGLITHVYFRTANELSSTRTLTDLRISIGHENPSNTVFTSTTFKTGLTQVYGSTTTQITTTANGWWGVQLATPFLYNGTDNLVIEATVTGNCDLRTNQNSSNGKKRRYGGRTATSGSIGSGQAACGLEIQSCIAKVTNEPDDSTICSGYNASFGITATNTNTYRWQVSTNGGSSWSNVSNNSIYSGATTDTLLLTGVPVTMDGYEYRCKITNTSNSCSNNSDAAILTVQKSPAILTTSPGYACTGGSSSQVGATATTGTTIEWYDQATGGSLLGTGNTLNISPLPATTTNYYAIPTASSVPVPGSLSVQLNATNGQRGCFMDIKPLKNITLTDISFVPAASSTYDIDIYIKTGTLVGSETNSSAWTQIAAATGISTTAGTPAKVALSSPQNLTANTTYAIYVVRGTNGGTIRYQTVSTLGGVEANNSDLEIMAGKGITDVFAGTLYSPRQFAGIVWYETGGGPSCDAPSRTAIALNIDAPPAISAHPKNQTVCNQANTSFSTTAANSASYQWQVSTNGGSTWSNIANGGVYSNATTATLNITGATMSMNNNQYRCNLTSPCSITANSNAATLTVQAAPSVTTDPANKTICPGDNTTFNAAGTGGGTMKYKWQVSTNGGSTWNNISNGGVYSNATTSTLTITGATLAMDNNRYRATISGTCTPVATTASATLTVNTPPAVVAHPGNDTVCLGNNASFTCNGTGTSITYQWQENTGSGWSNVTNGGMYSGATTNTLLITGVTAGMDNNLYRCEISGACPPTATTNNAILKTASDPVVTTQPASFTACSNATTSMSISATGYHITYQWQLSTNSGATWSNVTNTPPYSGVTTPTITFNNTPPALDGNMYRCVVTNACNIAANSNAATLNVATSPNISSQPASKVVCIGDNTTFSVAATSSSTINYQWQARYGTTWTNISNSANHSGVTTPTLTLTNIQPWMAADYRCIVNTGCIPVITTNGNATLTVNEQPVITSSPSNYTICQGGNAHFSVSAVGSNISLQWQESTNGGSTWSNISNGGIYSGATSNALLLSNVPPAENGNRYRCLVNGVCPTNKTSGSAILTVNTNVVMTGQSANSTTICSGGSTTMSVSATGSGITYKWYVNTGSGFTQISNNSNYSGASTGTLSISGLTVSGNTKTYTYYCLVQGTCSGVTSNTKTLNIQAKPSITSNPANQTVCDGTSSVGFSVVAGGTNRSYQWQLSTNGGSSWTNITNNSTYSGATTNGLLLNFGVNSMDNYRYRCVISGICTPNVVSKSARLTVIPTTIPAVTISSTDTTICDGSSVKFTPTPTNGGTPPSYQWKINGSNVATGATFTTSSLNNGDVVTCHMTSTANCAVPQTVASNAITMAVVPNGTPSITITSDVGTSWCSGKPATFRASIVDGGSNPSYQWTINGNNIGGNVDTLFRPVLLDGDVIECELTSSLKCAAPKSISSNKLKMTINQTTRSSIVISANPDTEICDQQEVKMSTAFTNGGPTPAFQWIRNGVDIPGATDGTFKTTNINNGDVITCRFISSNTCVFPEISNQVTFQVDPLLNPSVNVAVSYNGLNSYTFTALPVNGGTNPKYQWFRNFNKVAGETGATYTTSELLKSDVIYVLMVSSEKCVAPGLESVTSREVTTGVGGVSEMVNELGLHPNPNSGQFNITGTLNQPVNDEIVVKITNAVGQTVYNATYTSNGDKLNIPVQLDESLPNGMYMVNMVIEGQLTNLRFVVNR